MYNKYINSKYFLKNRNSYLIMEDNKLYNECSMCMLPADIAGSALGTEGIAGTRSGVGILSTGAGTICTISLTYIIDT